jgi:hypothetical protein
VVFGIAGRGGRVHCGRLEAVDASFTLRSMDSEAELLILTPNRVTVDRVKVNGDSPQLIY